MAGKVKFYRGLNEKVSTTNHKNGIYFSTDGNNPMIYMIDGNGHKYSYNGSNTWRDINGQYDFGDLPTPAGAENISFSQRGAVNLYQELTLSLKEKLGVNGTAAAASKLTTNKGGVNEPIYFSGGVPQSCGAYTVTSTGGTLTVTMGDQKGSLTKYVHPITTGYKHIPTGGSRGDFLWWTSDGTAAWKNVIDNSTNRIRTDLLPSYVDDVIEGYYNTTNGNFYKEAEYKTKITGESGKIYVDLSTNKTYRWSGSKFVVISETLALGTTSSTAYRGDLGAAATTTIANMSTSSDGTVGKENSSITVSIKGVTSTLKNTWRDINGQYDFSELPTPAGAESTSFSQRGAVNLYQELTLSLKEKLGVNGTAAAASKLTTNAGGPTTPVYFKGGVPVVCSHTLEKSVPADAVFTDTWRPMTDVYASEPVDSKKTCLSWTGANNMYNALNKHINDSLEWAEV